MPGIKPIAPRPDEGYVATASAIAARREREAEAEANAHARGSGVGVRVDGIVPPSSNGIVLLERKKRGRKRYSCAECRRLKLKCSKTWPCTMCERRGCPTICPDGVLERERKKRPEPVSELHERIALLEAAMKDPRAAKPPAVRDRALDPRIEERRKEVKKSNDPHVSATAGSLSISSGGAARYVGSLAGSAYLRDRGDGKQKDKENGSSQRPLDYHYSRLPDWDEGRGMIDAYWDHVNWIHQVIPRGTFENEYLPAAYERSAHPHQLACVFLAMALGVMFDLNRPPFHPRGRELFLLGRECLERTHEKASVATVQALTMVGTYVLNDNDSNGGESYWPILGNAVKIALSVGLHRDGEDFGLHPRDVDERRKVYWELMEYDRTQALSFGRPCGLSNRHADTGFPSDALFVDEAGYHLAKHKLVKMLERVVDIQVQPTPVPYSAVVDLDGELQEFRKSLPESLMCSVAIQDLPLDASLHPHLVLQRFGIRLFIAEARLHLNRAAFVQALKASPAAPSHGTFAAAFVALYESAQEIVQVVKQLVLYSPALAERWWFFWFHAFSAAVCLAAIPIEAPTCGFATPAFSGLSIVCDLSAAARDGCRVKDGLSTLLGLRKRAAEKLDASRHRVDVREKDTKDDELHRLLLAEKAERRGEREERGDRDHEGRSDSPEDIPRKRDFPNPLAPVRPSSAVEVIQPEPSIAAGPTLPLWPDAASVLIDYAGLEGNAAFELSIQPFLNQLEGYAWGAQQQ